MEEQNNKARVGIRGIAGLLGSRLVNAITMPDTEDLSLEVGVVIPDKSLETFLNRGNLIRGFSERLPVKMFMQSNKSSTRENELLKEWNAKQDVVSFLGSSQLNWKRHCDVIIDTAYPAGREIFEQQYKNFPGIILLQDGAAPDVHLIVPPFMGKFEKTTMFRMGDCILSGVIPILYPFRDMAEKIKLHMITQYTGREPDYLIAERAQSFFLREDVRERVEKDLELLFPLQEIEISQVVQIPSILHYQATIEIELKETISNGDLREMISEMPRIKMLPQGISSTYDVNLARSMKDSIPPIMIFQSSLYPKPRQKSTKVRISAAIYYRTAAVLPNLDAIRILKGGMDPLSAMRETDRLMGF